MISDFEPQVYESMAPAETKQKRDVEQMKNDMELAKKLQEMAEKEALERLLAAQPVQQPIS